MRALSLSVALFLFWLALSGLEVPALVAVGAVCAGLCAALAWRMGVLDSEGHPSHLLPRALTYFPWLLREILKSTWSVARIVVSPQLTISPALTRVFPTQSTPLGVNIFANSITLTPGTITVGVEKDSLIVHALTEDGAVDLEGGEMDRRVTRFEGDR